jgi:hypothetical protein
MNIICMDPGVRTGASLRAGFPDEGTPEIIGHRTIDDPKAEGNDPPVNQFRAHLDDLLDRWTDEVVIEEPSAAWHGKGNTAVMIQMGRIVTRLALSVQQNWENEPYLFAADDLRRSGQVVSNRTRPRLYSRIYGENAPNEHVRDAGLVAAKVAGVL